MTSKTLNFYRFALLVLAMFIALMLNSCMSFKKCKETYFEKITLQDTVQVVKEVVLTVPKDSIVQQFANDTSFFFHTFREGRAKVIIKRTHDTTYVQAECDSAKVTEKVTFKYLTPKITFGVSPHWRIATWLLIGALIVLFVLYLTKPKK